MRRAVTSSLRIAVAIVLVSVSRQVATKPGQSSIVAVGSPATGVTVVNLPEHLIWRDMPEGVTLGPMQSHQIFMSGTGQQGVPAEIEITCDQTDAPAFVPVPPKF